MHRSTEVWSRPEETEESQLKYSLQFLLETKESFTTDAAVKHQIVLANAATCSLASSCCFSCNL